jgi:hypothetical protein
VTFTFPIAWAAVGVIRHEPEAQLLPDLEIQRPGGDRAMRLLLIIANWY